MDERARRRIARVLLLPWAKGVIPGAPDDVLDELVDLASGHARSERLDPRVLGAQHDVVDLPDLRRRLTLRNGARHVGPESRLFVLGDDVHDDRLARRQRAGPDLVRVA